MDYIIILLYLFIYLYYYYIINVFMNSNSNSETQGNDKYVALSRLLIGYTWKYIKKSYKNNKFKMSPPACNKEFELPDGLYSVSDLKDCFHYIF